MDSEEVRAARNEEGDWTACVERLLGNEAKAAKFSFKNLEAHADELGAALAANESVLFLDLSCNSFTPVSICAFAMLPFC
jgi:hypothetical protein